MPPVTYHFPVEGHQGDVQDHWGSVKGGSDIFAKAGTPVAAMVDGKILSAGYNSVGGYYAIIQGDDGNQYYYAHMQEQPSVGAGAKVKASRL